MDLVKALRECYSTLAAAHEVLMDIRQGRHEVNAEGWKVIEEHNLEALKVGQETLEEIDRIANGAEDSLQIKRWISPGELLRQDDDENDAEELPETVQQLYDQVGTIIDDSSMSEILGILLFEGANGKYYEMSVEGALSEASPERVADFLPREDHGN